MPGWSALAHLSHLAAQVAGKVDSAQGTSLASAGAKARITEPHMYDAIFPVIAFLLVVVLPSTAVLWVMYKTLTEKDPDKSSDEKGA